MAKTKSLNCYSHHAPKMEWMKQYFEYKDEFSTQHSLGSQMYDFFRRFLRDALLLDKNGFTEIAQKLSQIGLDEDVFWAIILTNVSYAPEIGWFVKQLKFGETYNREYVALRLVEDGAKESWVGDVWSAFGRFLELPFNKVGMGYGVKEKNRFVSLQRTPWENPDSRVILYSLYKFAEACDGYYQFTLTTLMDATIERNGVSPAELFGLSRDTLEKIVSGLSVNYPEFIQTSFTLDLDTISLKPEKSAMDVLTLF